MVRQDYAFMVMLMLALIFFTHWGGRNQFKL